MNEQTQETACTGNASQLKAAWEDILNTIPGLRIREAAQLLGVGEAQLLATTVGDGCIRLKRNWHELVNSWKTLGHVMSLTRNAACILEHKGNFQKINTFGDDNGGMGTVIGPIESRIFFEHWHVAFAVKQVKNGRLLQSIQVFDKAGDAVTKIYLQERSNLQAWHQLIENFRSGNQSREQEVEAYTEEEHFVVVEKDSFLADWQGLKDTHDFFPLLKRHKLHRYHAVELAAGTFTWQLEVSAVQQILETASATKLPIMIFAGNKGNLQIHQGKVRTIRLLERGHTGKEKWLNVLDPAFNMHLKMDLVDTAWVVKKPTKDGIVTAVELFDKEKKLIAQFFGLRKPGIPQKEEWHQLVDGLARFNQPEE